MVKQAILWRKVKQTPDIETPSESLQRRRKQYSSVKNHFQILMKTRFKESNTPKGTEVAIFKGELHVLDEEKRGGDDKANWSYIRASDKTVTITQVFITSTALVIPETNIRNVFRKGKNAKQNISILNNRNQ